MVYRTIIHLNIELQIPVIYRADLGYSWLYPFVNVCPLEYTADEGSGRLGARKQGSLHQLGDCCYSKWQS